ncbi:hypothetical protein [Thermomonas sp. HDW16]|uniref:hypothetical protein n=1 Tax=Thermomonas sp. HDW16 TaxID=2714945 RepID=UPI00140BCB31|nr:hypothetical protein [Thermomonas sp. HDW16]QIL21158.1 hypothetical protein G7079_10685 [Thermomonas sp. HDW16]
MTFVAASEVPGVFLAPRRRGIAHHVQGVVEMRELVIDELELIDGGMSMEDVITGVGGAMSMYGGLEMMVAAVALGPFGAGAAVFIGGAILVSVAIN